MPNNVATEPVTDDNAHWELLYLRTKVKTLAIGRDVCTSKPLRISWHLCASGYSKFAPCHHDLALANSFSTENMHSCHSEMEISEAVFPRAFSSQVSCMVPPNTCRSGHTGAPASQLIIDLTQRQQCQWQENSIAQADESCWHCWHCRHKSMLVSNSFKGFNFMICTFHVHVCLGLPGKSPDSIRFNMLACLKSLQSIRNCDELVKQRRTCALLLVPKASENMALGCLSTRLEAQPMIEAWRSMSAYPVKVWHVSPKTKRDSYHLHCNTAHACLKVSKKHEIQIQMLTGTYW